MDKELKLEMNLRMIVIDNATERDTDDLFLTIHKNGAINFTDKCTSNFIYLYPEQVKILKSALEVFDKIKILEE